MEFLHPIESPVHVGSCRSERIRAVFEWEILNHMGNPGLFI